MKAIYLLKYEVTRNEGYEQITACIYQINLAHVKEICGYGDMYDQSYITVYYTNGNEIEGQILLPLQKDAEDYIKNLHKSYNPYAKLTINYSYPTWNLDIKQK